MPSLLLHTRSNSLGKRQNLTTVFAAPSKAEREKVLFLQTQAMIPAFVTLTSSMDLLSSEEIPNEPSTKHLLGAGGINLTAWNTDVGSCCGCQLAAPHCNGLVQ